jgi:hypothetical protein
LLADDVFALLTHPTEVWDIGYSDVIDHGEEDGKEGKERSVHS